MHTAPFCLRFAPRDPPPNRSKGATLKTGQIGAALTGGGSNVDSIDASRHLLSRAAGRLSGDLRGAGLLRRTCEARWHATGAERRARPFLARGDRKADEATGVFVAMSDAIT